MTAPCSASTLNSWQPDYVFSPPKHNLPSASVPISTISSFSASKTFLLTSSNKSRLLSTHTFIRVLLSLTIHLFEALFPGNVVIILTFWIFGRSFSLLLDCYTALLLNNFASILVVFYPLTSNFFTFSHSIFPPNKYIQLSPCSQTFI